MAQLTQPKGMVSKETNKEAIARVFGLKKRQVGYLSTLASVDSYTILYEEDTQTCWYRGAATGTPLSWSISSESLILVTDSGSYTLTQAVSDVNLRKSLQTNGDKLINIKNSAIGSVTRTQEQKNNETLSVLDFGAKPDDASIDNQYFIQAAVDAANTIYINTGSPCWVYVPPGVYWLGNRSTTPTGSTSTYGILSIQMKSGVKLYGPGVLKCKDSAYGTGAFYRIIGSDRGAPISDSHIEGITVDGNVSNQIASAQCSNIVIEALSNVTVKNVTSINSNGNGIILRGSITTAARGLKVVDCYVYNCTSTGIQCSQFNGLVISGNTVDTTTNNCIDVYGDTGVSASVSNGLNFTITGNTVRNSGVCGIFPETCANGVVSGNSVYNCPEGIHVNRIYSVPKNIVISDNSIYGASNSGIYISGDMQGIVIRDNSITDFGTYGMRLGAEPGNISNISVSGNYFNPTNSSSIILNIQGAIASRIEVRNNTVRNNIGLAMSSIYTNTATTSSGVYVDSWAFTAGSISSTGLEMYRTSTNAPTVIGTTTSGSATYTVQNAQYYRVGELVYYTIEVTYSALTGTGSLSIGGLPWKPNTSVSQPEFAVQASNVTLSTGQTLYALPQAAGLNLRIRTTGSAGVTSYLTLTGSTYTSGNLRVSGWYIAAI